MDILSIMYVHNKYPKTLTQLRFSHTINEFPFCQGVIKRKKCNRKHSESEYTLDASLHITQVSESSSSS